MPGSESEGGHGGGDGDAGGLGCRAIGEGEGGEAGVLGMERESEAVRRRRHGFRALDWRRDFGGIGVVSVDAEPAWLGPALAV
jgi:hypothetical protein